tara:strand:+ start:2293 stop:2994 length:702 start_codon:yes stop_codon:yes gene_type:complete
MNSNTNFLTEIKNISNDINVFIPSTKSDVKCKPLNLQQQKNILDDISSDASSILTFFNNSYKIINQCIENSKDLLVIDRPNILISLRNNIDNMYDDVNLSKLLEKNKEIEVNSVNEVIETNDFIFDVGIPTLEQDYKSNDYLVKAFKGETKILGKLYVNELSKFIKKITIKSSENVIDFTDSSIKDKFNIIQNIETNNFKDIYKFITSIRDLEKAFVTLNDETVDIGPELFVL